MPAQKDFKRLVRARMHKTGEAYTAARANLLGSLPLPRRASALRPALAAPVTATLAAPPADYARLAGMSDAKVKAATGCPWERWVTTLDRHRAYEWPHRDIAAFIREQYKTPSWWTQTVTVGYERIKGLRERGQGRDGGYAVSKSKTLAVPLKRLYTAFRDRRIRARWLPDVDLAVRTAIREKSLRITWPDRTWVMVAFTAKGKARSHVALEHTRLSSKSAASEAKAFWTGRFERLAQVLA